MRTEGYASYSPWDDEGRRDRQSRHGRRRKLPEGSTLRELPLLIVVALAIALVIKVFLFQAFYIPSASMENTLMVNDRILVSKFAYDFSTPQPGQIVVFVPPSLASELPPPPTGLAGLFNTVKSDLGLPSATDNYIKRVIAVGGDTVEIRHATLYVNGNSIDEPYLDADARKPTSMLNYGPYTVPAQHLFVMGDNRGDSQDSRYFGAIPESSVVGQAVVRIWPFTRLRIF